MSKNPITIEALEVLDAIDRRESFAKAAEELNKVPSAISYIIQKLEEQLDVTLFQRQGRRSVLTPAGRILLDEGRSILAASHRLADLTRETATGWEPRLRIAIEGILDSDNIFPILHDFLQQHPQVELDIREVILGGGWEALELDQVDLVIGAPGPAPAKQGFRSESLGCTDMIYVVTPDNPLLELPQPIPRDHPLLQQMRRVVAHDTSRVGVPRSTGLFEGSQLFYVQTMEQKIAAQCAGIGIGRLPSGRIQSQLQSGELKEIEIEAENKAGEIGSERLLAWKISHKGKALRALTKMILDQYPQC